MESAFFYDSHIGKIGIAEDGNSITNIFFENEELVNFELRETPLIKEAHKQFVNPWCNDCQADRTLTGFNATHE